MEMQNGIVYTNQKETQVIKRKLYDIHNGVCPLLDCSVPIDKMVADHQHKLKGEPCSDWSTGGKGLIRGAISFDANAIEGKIVNAWSRYGMNKYDISVSDFLRNLADYLEEPPAKKLDECYAYYSEKPKRTKVKISEHKRVMKYYLFLNTRKRKLPKKLTYVTDDWLEQVQKTNKLIEDMNDDKDLKKMVNKFLKEIKDNA